MWNKDDWSELGPWLDRLYRQRRKWALGLFLMLLTALAAMGLLSVSGWFITATAVSVVALNIYIPGSAIRFFALLRTVSRYFERVVNHEFVLRMQAAWRVQLFSGLVHQHPLATRRYSLARVLQRLTQDLDALDALYLRVLAPFAVALLSIIVLSMLVAVWLPATALLIFFLLLIGWLTLALPVAERLKALANTELVASEQLRAHSLDHVNGQAEMQSWQVQNQHAEKVLQTGNALSSAQARLSRRQNIIQAVIEGAIQVLVVVVAVSALVASRHGQLDAAVAVLLALALMALPETLLVLPQASALWGRVVGSAARLNSQITNEPTNLTLKRGASAIEAPWVRLIEVSVNYQQRQVWKDLSVELQAGSVNVLTGPSGQGKSTFAYLLTGLLEPSSGNILINGATPTAEWYRSVAYFTQQTSLLTGSVEQNLRLAEKSATDSQLWRALETVELAERVRSMPNQLKAWIGDGGARLSGGEGRRLALARVLLKSAGLVVLDEPFRGIDSVQARRLWENMQPWLENKTVLLIAHQNDFLPSGYRFLKFT